MGLYSPCFQPGNSFSPTEPPVVQTDASRGAWSSVFSTNPLGLDGSKAKPLVSHGNFLTSNTFTRIKAQKAINFEKQTAFENIILPCSLF